MRKIAQNKKGLAEIITVILIILLSLAAIGIIWTVIRPVIMKTSSQIDLACTTGLKMSIDSAICNPTSDVWTVKLSRDAGDGKLKTINFVFGTGEDSKKIAWTKNTKDANNDVPGMIGELEMKTYRFDRVALGIPNSTIKVSIAPVVEGSGGSEIACPTLDTKDCMKE